MNDPLYIAVWCALGYGVIGWLCFLFTAAMFRDWTMRPIGAKVGFILAWPILFPWAIWLRRRIK